MNNVAGNVEYAEVKNKLSASILTMLNLKLPKTPAYWARVMFLINIPTITVKP